jgi:radical SAM superfamily enzyme YgiQ (UPF0313 family)
MAKITFVEPKSEFNAYGYGFLTIPLLGTLYLGTMLEAAGHDVGILCENVKPAYNRRTGKLHSRLKDADIVGISSVTATARRAYAIADEIRKVSPKTKIVMGGPHVTFLPEEALAHADVVVKGEAEKVIFESFFEAPRGTIVQGCPLENLDELSFPRLGLVEGLSRTVRHLPPLRPWLGYIPMGTSRGCPYDCLFCSVTSMFGRRFRFRSPGNVLEELKLRVSEGYHHFFFYDDNLSADLSWAKELLETIISSRLRICWFAQARVEVARDPKLVALLPRAGCKELLIGFESINPATLKRYNKRQDVADIKHCVAVLHKAGLRVCGMFVLGADEDNPETIDATIRFCDDMKLDHAQFAILIPLPGTGLYQQLEQEGRIFNKDWSLYDGTHVVFYPSHFTVLELHEKVYWAWKKFYRVKRSLKWLVSRYMLHGWMQRNRQYLAELKKLARRRFVPSLGKTVAGTSGDR